MHAKWPRRTVVFAMAMPWAAALGHARDARPEPPASPPALVAPVGAADDPEGVALVQAAWRAVAAYHGGQRDAHDVLRVVYFYPTDGEPLARYVERLREVMRDISDFYRDGLLRFGIPNEGLPLELKDGQLVVHLVRGRRPAREYNHGSTEETAADVRASLGKSIDLDREHVVVFYGFDRKEADGSYVADGPYCGSGSHRSGMAHAADFTYLDRDLLEEAQRTVTHNQDGDPRFVQTLGEFNSWYIGGAAHEIGHGLGLPHDFGHPAERRFGFSLMGIGNRMYRQELRGDGKPAFLSRVSALQLVSHPFFTRSNRGRWDDVHAEFERLDCVAEAGVLQIRGKVTATIPAYAVVAYVWPASGDEHYAQSFPALVNGGEFALQIGPLPPQARAAQYSIRLASLHVNGAVVSKQYDVPSTFGGDPDAAALTADFLVSRAERAIATHATNAPGFVSDDAIDRAPTPAARRQLRALREIINAPAPVDLRTCAAKAVFLSDAIWRKGEVGWGQPARNHYWFDGQSDSGLLLRLKGEFIAKGIYAHAPSRYVFDLDRQWKRLSARVGLQDGAYPPQASAAFTVRGDGRELYRSARLRVDESADVRVDVTGVKVLELSTDSGWEHNYNSWAVWFEPALER